MDEYSANLEWLSKIDVLLSKSNLGWEARMALQEAVDSYKKSHTSGVWKAHDASYFNPYDHYDFVCSECGSEGDSYFEFCPSCGTRMYPPGTQKKPFTEDDV